ncbi:protein of unknown function [Pseudodesulfovibrio profundus]|uniref:Uncharacterized protein n=1 Tax=Pseudodesulfovibrio profundus TaxID=57320 RepID=A0A2C8F8Y2_9BACT|nr:protein of unknown function [Pseudodesulfovibrio profundus]
MFSPGVRRHPFILLPITGWGVRPTNAIFKIQTPMLAFCVHLHDIATVKQYLIIIFTLLMAVTAFAQEDDPWVPREVCVFGMPYVGRAVQPGQAGLYTEILQSVYEDEGIGFKHKSLPYPRALQSVTDSRIQCTLSVRDQFNDVVQGAVSLALYDLVAVHFRSTDFTGVDSLRDKRVAYLNGFDWQEYITVKMSPQEVYDLGFAFQMLDRGHVEYIIGDKDQLLEALPRSGIQLSDLRISPITTLEVCPIFSPSESGRRLKEVYDRRMQELVDSGALDHIYQRHGVNIRALHGASVTLD